MNLEQFPEAEAKEIEYIVERLNGLHELLMIVNDDALAEKIRGEMAELEAACDGWWNKMPEK